MGRKRVSPVGGYTCPYCPLRYLRVEHIERHIRKHTGEKPFVCSVEGCSRRFSRKDNMMQHVRTHQKGKKDKGEGKKGKKNSKVGDEKEENHSQNSQNSQNDLESVNHYKEEEEEEEEEEESYNEEEEMGEEEGQSGDKNFQNSYEDEEEEEEERKEIKEPAKEQKRLSFPGSISKLNNVTSLNHLILASNLPEPKGKIQKNPPKFDIVFDYHTRVDSNTNSHFKPYKNLTSSSSSVSSPSSTLVLSRNNEANSNISTSPNSWKFYEGNKSRSAFSKPQELFIKPTVGLHVNSNSAFTVTKATHSTTLPTNSTLNSTTLNSTHPKNLQAGLTTTSSSSSLPSIGEWFPMKHFMGI